MGGFGWAELLVIGIVALVVIGPKDLPEMFRQLGRVTAKARAMAGEFSRAMEQAAKETGAAEAARDIKTMTSAKSMGLDKVRSVADSFEKWDPLSSAKPQGNPAQKPLTPPPMPPNPAPKAQELADAPKPQDVAETPKPPRKSKAQKADMPDAAPKPAPKPRKPTVKSSAAPPAPKATS
jgi:sec-independent protein translocase protein TatB